ncbi:MAG TPA: hypothetical protein VFZ53_08565 [Polyangiaceae bacterium]
MKRTASVAVIIATALACARSGLELGDAAGEGDDARARGGTPSTGDDDVGGSSTGGTVPTGGTGGTSTGGSGGSLPPLDPGGPIPNCAADSPVTVFPKDNRWLFLRGRPNAEAEEGNYLIELTPEGPRGLTFLDDGSEFWDWSSDGRFFVLQGAVRPYPYEVFDMAQGTPVRVDVPSRSGFLELSHGARYALDPDPSSALPSQLFIVDPRAATERAIELPERHLMIDSWSPNDRYLALADSGGLVLVDTAGPELALATIHDSHASDVRWSADGRYLAFQSVSSRGSIGKLYVYDTEGRHLDLLQTGWRPTFFYGWAGNSMLVVQEGGGFIATIDVTRRPLESVVLADAGRTELNAAISPGNQCLVYEGYCEAPDEEGICVVALPPNPLAPPVLIHRLDGNPWSKTWAGTGDQLLVHFDATPWLINVALDGGDFTRQPVTDGSVSTPVQTLPGWNPNGRSDWLAYFASPNRARLWRRPTGMTFDVPLNGDYPSRWAWSADGRYFVVHGVPSSGDGAYYVQEVFEGRTGRTWRISELLPSEGGESLWPHFIQP